MKKIILLNLFCLLFIPAFSATALPAVAEDGFLKKLSKQIKAQYEEIIRLNKRVRAQEQWVKEFEDRQSNRVSAPTVTPAWHTHLLEKLEETAPQFEPKRSQNREALKEQAKNLIYTHAWSNCAQADPKFLTPPKDCDQYATRLTNRWMELQRLLNKNETLKNFIIFIHPALLDASRSGFTSYHVGQQGYYISAERLIENLIQTAPGIQPIRSVEPSHLFSPANDQTVTMFFAAHPYAQGVAHYPGFSYDRSWPFLVQFDLKDLYIKFSLYNE